MAVSDIHWHTLLVVVLLLHLQCLQNPFVQACGGTFTSSSGVLTSPSYPSSYPNNMDCTYVITQPSGYFITLTFTVFSLQTSVNCSRDFLEIRNGGSSVSPILGTRLCGSQLPPVQRSTRNLMWMRFKTNYSVTNSGFQASYTTCGGNFNGSSGVITSPSYPQLYQDNLWCVYTITQSQGLPIALFFEDFDTEGSSTCSFDYVEIRDGNSDTSPLLTPRLCGPVLPPVLCSTQRYMRLLFRTDDSVVRKGFRATYSVCGGNFTESSGIIRSPSYPNKYPNNIDYSYIINQTPGSFIYLNFMDFSLEYNSNCLYDYVEIRDGDTFASPVLGNRLCDSLLPPVQRTTQNVMWIRFKTDGSSKFKGFQASYTTCGGIFTSAQGYIQSPSYPSNYPSNMDCVYLISQQSGYHIYLNFTNFMLQSGSYCLEDYVEIRDGRSATSPLIGNRLCGSSIPPIMRSTQNVMRIHFKTNYALTYSGFKAMYHVDNPAYSGNIRSNKFLNHPVYEK